MAIDLTIAVQATNVDTVPKQIRDNLSQAFAQVSRDADTFKQKTTQATSAAVQSLTGYANGLSALSKQVLQQTTVQGNLAGAYLRTGQAAGAQAQTLRALEQQYAKTQQAAKQLQQQSSQGTAIFTTMARSLASLGAVLGVTFGVGAIVSFTKSIVDAGIAQDRMMLSLRGALGSAQAAGEAYAFVEGVANRLGIGLLTAAESFAKLSAATQGTVVQGQATRDLFIAISEASRVMGLTSAETGGIVVALTQIIGKNTVSMEELRQQLGERLPSALRLTAQEMGVTTSRFIEMVSKGQVLAVDFIPAVTRAMVQMGKEAPAAAQSVQAALERVGNAWLTLKVTIAQSGVLELVARIAEEMTRVINQTTAWINRTKRLSGELGLAPLVAEMQRITQEAQRWQEILAQPNIFAPLEQQARTALTALEAQRDALAERIRVQQRVTEAQDATTKAENDATEAKIKAQEVENKRLTTLREMSKTYTGLEDNIKGVTTQLEALRSRDVPSLEAMGLRPSDEGFETRWREREAALLKQHQDLLDKRAGLEKGAGARAVQEAGQSAVERAKAAEAALETQLKREETLIQQSATERRRIIDEAATTALQEQGPGAVESIAAQRMQDLRAVAVETAQALETLRLETLDKQRQAREVSLQAEIAAAGQNLSAATAAQQELLALEAETEVERAVIRQQRLEAEQKVGKQSVDEQIKQARELNTLLADIEQERLQSRIALVDDQIALIEAQMAGEVITVKDGQAQIQALQVQRFDDLRLKYEQAAQQAIDAVQVDVEAEEIRAAQIAKIREGLTADLAALDVQQKTQQQQHLNELSEGWREWVRDVRSGLQDFLVDIFEGQVRGIQDVFDRIKSYFFQLIAKLITYAATNAIIIPIVSGVFGGGGTGATAGGFIQMLRQAIGGGTGGTGAASGSLGWAEGLGLLSSLKTIMGGFGSSLESLEISILKVVNLVSRVGGGPGVYPAGFVGPLPEGSVVTGAVGPALGIAGGLAALAGGIYGAITATNNFAKAAFAASAAAGAFAAGTAAAGAGVFGASAATAVGTGWTGVGLIVAAVLAVIGTVLQYVIKPAGPALGVRANQGDARIGVEGGKLQFQGTPGSTVIRREGFGQEMASDVQASLAQVITTGVQTMIDALNTVALKPEALIGPAQEALRRAISEAAVINTANAKKAGKDIEEQLKFVQTQVMSFFLQPLVEAMGQLRTGTLEEQLTRLGPSVVGMVGVFRSMNEQLENLQKSSNTDVLRQLQSVRQRVEAFGRNLADMATQVGEALVKNTAAALSKATTTLLAEPLTKQITAFATLFDDSFRALTTLRQSVEALSSVKLPTGGLESQITTLTETMVKTAAQVSEKITTAAINDLRKNTQAVQGQSLDVRSVTTGAVFTDALQTYAALVAQLNRFAAAELDTAPIQAQMDRLLGEMLTSAGNLIRQAWDPNQFDDFLAVLISIPESLAALNPVFKEARDLGLKFAQVVAPISKQIADYEAALRSPAETVAQTAKLMTDLQKAIADAGTSVDKVLPLYAQYAAAIVANAEAQIAQVRAISAVIGQIDQVLFARLTGPQQLQRLDDQISSIMDRYLTFRSSNDDIGMLSQAGRMPTTGFRPDDIAQLVTLYTQQLSILAQMQDVLESTLTAIEDTLASQGSILDRVALANTRLQEQLALIAKAGGAEQAAPEDLSALVGFYTSLLGAVQELIGVLTSGIASIDDTLFGLLSESEQAAQLQQEIQGILTQINTTGKTTPEQLIELAGLAQKALSAQQAISRLLQGALESTRATIAGAETPEKQIAGVQGEIATLMKKVAAGTATPEELVRLVELNQKLLSLGQQHDLLDIQKKALDNLKILEPILKGALDQSKSLEKQMVDLLTSIRTELEKQLDSAKNMEGEILKQLTALQPILQGQLDKLQTMEEQIVNTLRDQLKVLQDQLLAQYGTTDEQKIIRDIQEKARMRLEDINKKLADLFGSQEAVRIILGLPIPIKPPPDEKEPEKATARAVESLETMLRPPIQMKGTNEQQSMNVRIVYMQASYAQGGPVGILSGAHYQRGGMIPALLEPGERVFAGPLRGSQLMALSAVNDQFPRFGAPQSWSVPGTGSGDRIPAFLPPGSFVVNRNAAHAMGRQGGGPVSTPGVGASGAQRPPDVHIHLDLRGAHFSDAADLERLKHMLIELRRRGLRP